MLAKIIAKGKNRDEAITKIIDALESTHIQGIQTNQDFLINILQTKEFNISQIDTNFISKNINDGFKGTTNETK